MIISISTVCFTEGIIKSKSAEVFNLQVFWFFVAHKMDKEFQEREGTLKIFVYFGTYYGTAVA